MGATSDTNPSPLSLVAFRNYTAAGGNAMFEHNTALPGRTAAIEKHDGHPDAIAKAMERAGPGHPNTFRDARQAAEEALEYFFDRPKTYRVMTRAGAELFAVVGGELAFRVAINNGRYVVRPVDEVDADAVAAAYRVSGHDIAPTNPSVFDDEAVKAELDELTNAMDD